MNWDVVANFALGLILVTGILAAVRYPRLSPVGRMVAVLVWFTVAVELAGQLVNQLLPSNLFLMPVAVLGEVVLLTLAYRRALASPRLGRWLLGALGLYVVFLATEVWLKLGTVQFYAAAQVVSDLFALGLAALYFWQLLSKLRVANLWHDPAFWLSAGIAIYSLGDLFLALSSDYIMAHFSYSTQMLVLSGARNFCSILLYADYLVIVWMRPPKPSF